MLEPAALRDELKAIAQRVVDVHAQDDHVRDEQLERLLYILPVSARAGGATVD